MTFRRRILLCVTALAVLAPLPAAIADIIVFGDGFAIEGRVKEEKTVIFDSGSGAAISVPKSGKPFWLDDGFRNIFFAPFQVKEALRDKTKRVTPDQVLKLASPNPQSPMPPLWVIDDSSAPWNEHWEREITLRTAQGGKVKVNQRITSLSPESIKVESKSHDWQVYYNTKEFDPKVVRDLVYQHFSKKKDKKKDGDIEIRLKVYEFLLQAEFTAQAEKEVDDLLRDFPTEQSKIGPLKDHLKRLAAAQVVGGLERSQNAGLYDDVEHKLKSYSDKKLDDLLQESAQLRVQAVKDKHDAIKTKLLDAGELVQGFATLTPPSQRKLFQSAADAIVKELNPDTVDRLDTFFSVAADYQRALKDKRDPEQSATEVMAFALTGWLRGSDAAERNAEVALQQWQVRQLLLEYLRTDDPLARKNKLLPALKAVKVSVDEAMQMLRRLPPVDPLETISTKPQTLQTKNNGKPYSYAIQLPPGYNHGRSWPVLIALHHSEENAAGALARWTDLAAQHGYIVVAPEWGKGPKSVYQFSAQEHGAVLETLRDLRRRFQIDSDRVFLFGGEQGGVMAFDLGLAHPDQFTGVVPMSAAPLFFARRYWPNAQNLHMYIINGERSTFVPPDTQASLTRAMFNEFIRGNFPAIYVEYKGRPAEWFGAERPIIFDWMNRKRRMDPLKEVGKDGYEFRTQRDSDKQFYWLSAQTVQPNYLNSAAGWNTNIKHATLRATVFSNTNEIQVKTTGLGRVSLWFPPKLINYGEKVSIRVNGAGPVKYTITPNLDTLLETLYQTGDRQRLYFARLDL
jgi:pimeloyl-ACP methyl ester carboxylesterase